MQFDRKIFVQSTLCTQELIYFGSACEILGDSIVIKYVENTMIEVICLIKLRSQCRKSDEVWKTQ